MTIQSPSAVIMVRPHHFQPNPQTMADNGFQAVIELDAKTLAQQAYQQVTTVAEMLEQQGINVWLFDDVSTQTPDSVFPNNWFCTRADGSLSLFPMFCENRRLEVRDDIIDNLRQHYQLSTIRDYRYLIEQQYYLEGTGAMVIDHQHNLVFATRSNRMNEHALAVFCADNNYQAIVFDALDQHGNAIYHTNVMMSVASDFVVIALDTITDSQQKQQVINAVKQTGKQLIDISLEQMNHFAGNVFELINPQGNKLLAISKTSTSVLSAKQLKELQQHVQLLVCDVSALELAGGSIRCMLAGVHLAEK